MAVEVVGEVVGRGPGGPAAAPASAVPPPSVVPSPREPAASPGPVPSPGPVRSLSHVTSSPGPVASSTPPGPVAVDAALVDVMVQGARVVAAAEAAGLAALAGLVLGRQGAAREELRAWRREHPGSRLARQDWDAAAADCEESVAGEVADEVAAALRVSRRTARARLDLAVDLMTVAPATLQALRTGALDLPRAQRVVEAVAPVHAQDPALAAVVEAEVLTRAGDQTPAQVAASARRVVLRHARAVAQQASEQAHQQRRVGVQPADDPAGRDAGQASLWISGRADRVEAAFANLTRTARAHLDTHPDDTRTLDQVRADLALTALLADLRTGRLRTPHPDDPAHDPGTGPSEGRALGGDVVTPDGPAADPTRVPDPPVTVHLVLPLSTLTGGNEPAELLGHGPIPAPLARDLLLRTEAGHGTGPPDHPGNPGRHQHLEHPVTVLLREDVTFTRWLTDPTGIVTTTGTRTYRPPAGLARTIRARDLTCRFPGCRTPATRCDLDHTTPWPTGDTSPQNLTALCRGHHDGKTMNRWNVTLDPTTATLTWTAPTGHTYTTHPPTWPEGP